MDMSLESMSWLTPIEFCLCNQQITGEDPQGGYTAAGFKMFAMTCPHVAWSCQKSGRQLRTDLSGGC